MQARSISREIAILVLGQINYDHNKINLIIYKNIYIINLIIIKYFTIIIKYLVIN